MRHTSLLGILISLTFLAASIHPIDQCSALTIDELMGHYNLPKQSKGFVLTFEIGPDPDAGILETSCEISYVDTLTVRIVKSVAHRVTSQSKHDARLEETEVEQLFAAVANELPTSYAGHLSGPTFKYEVQHNGQRVTLQSTSAQSESILPSREAERLRHFILTTCTQ